MAYSLARRILTRRRTGRLANCEMSDSPFHVTVWHVLSPVNASQSSNDLPGIGVGRLRIGEHHRMRPVVPAFLGTDAVVESGIPPRPRRSRRDSRRWPPTACRRSGTARRRHAACAPRVRSRSASPTRRATSRPTRPRTPARRYSSRRIRASRSQAETGVRGYCHATAPNLNVDSFTEGYAHPHVNKHRDALGIHTPSCPEHRARSCTGLVGVLLPNTKSAIPVIPAEAGIQRGPGGFNTPISTTD